MSQTIDLNRKANVKQKTAADILPSAGLPVVAQYEADSTAGQTSISLPFIADSTSPENLWVFVDGKRLRYGAASDFTFAAVDGAGGSSLISLNSALPAGLNILVSKLGVKKEAEFQTDARFTQMYSMLQASTQGFADESSLLTAINGTPSASQFRTFGIKGRASIPDLSNDLKARIGIDRRMIQQIVYLPKESGPNGELVYGVLNDDRNQVRLVGNWSNLNDTSGLRVIAAPASDPTNFIEIVFYGTGLNILALELNVTQILDVDVDGTTGSSLTVGNTSNSIILQARSYSPNQVYNVVSGLSLGLHTVRLKGKVGNSSNIQIQGFETLTEATTINIRPGVSYQAGKKLTLSSAQSISHNSSFDSIIRDGASVGSLSTRGAHVVVYQKADGSIGKAAIETNSAQANLSSADHTNEEVMRIFSPREFGANRSDDFSSLATSNSERSFVLDDGTTSLHVVSGVYPAPLTSGRDVLAISNLSNMTFTFVGTGLDVVLVGDGNSRQFAVSIDGGASIGNVALSTNDIPTRFSIVSGLPYGTHVVKFTENLNTSSPRFLQLIVYQPKKPSLPSGAFEIADYNLMATFAANSTADIYHISTGILRKNCTREFVYVNGTGGTTDWNIPSLNAAYIDGRIADSDRLNSYFEYTFFGTGFDLRFEIGSANSSNITVSLNGTTLTSTNFPTASFSTYGTGAAFNSSTGILDQLDAGATEGAGFTASGLPLAKYTVRFNNNSAGSFLEVMTLDIITPVHAPRSNLPEDLQNTLMVGSCSVGDSRRLSLVKSEDPKKVMAFAFGVTSGPTSTATTFVPVPDLSITVNSKGAWFMLSYGLNAQNSGNNTFGTALFVNGLEEPGTRQRDGSNGVEMFQGASKPVYLSAGNHKIDVYWFAGAGTNTTNGVSRFVSAVEL